MKDIWIPDIRRPTDNQWRIWKNFLFRNFLSPGVNINPPLGTEYATVPPPTLPLSDTDKLLSIEAEGRTLREIIELIPKSLTVIAGEVIIPEDGGIKMCDAIVEGRCIGASDGSLIRGFQRVRGAHGYALRDEENSSIEIAGYGPSPASDDMSSLTTEHYGVIGLLILLHALCKKYMLCEEECFGRINIYVDNKTVVDRCNKEQECINISDYSVPEQDLWKMTTELISKLPIKINVEWIKGHQDVDRYGNRIFGPFNRETQMNMLVDDLASLGMVMGETTLIQRPNFSTSTLSIHNDKDVHISDLRKYMIEKMNGARMIQYYEDRRGWTKEILAMIEWEGIDVMLRQARPIRRIKIVKLMHNWQNVGRQKGKIRDAKLKLETDNPLQPTKEEIDCHLCPGECGEEEGHLHYLSCQEKTAKTARRVLIRKVLTKLKKVRTYEGITSMFGRILSLISEK